MMPAPHASPSHRPPTFSSPSPSTPSAASTAIAELKAALDARTKPSLPDCHVVFVVGGPGAGKGTQCLRLVDQFGGRVCHLSAGDLLREEQRRKDSSPLGALIISCINEGLIVPMQVTITLLERAMQREISEHGTTRFLIDGFPRAVDQGVEFERAVCPSRALIFMQCPQEIMQERLLKRAALSGRTDDNATTIAKRFRTFQETTMPVIDHFANKLHTVDCDGSPDEVYRRFHHAIVNILDL